MNSQETTTKRIVRVAVLSAIAFAFQIVIAAIPNIELVSLFFIVITLVFTKDSLYVVTVFTLLQGITYGFGIWWLSYLYIWPLHCFAVMFLKNKLKENWSYWAIYAAFFGLVFGALTALPYIIIDSSYVISYWISGIPFDIVHCISNFITTLFLAKPLYSLLIRLKKE